MECSAQDQELDLMLLMNPFQLSISYEIICKSPSNHSCLGVLTLTYREVSAFNEEARLYCHRKKEGDRPLWKERCVWFHLCTVHAGKQL